MARREDIEARDHGLRAKYEELSRKYSALVGREPRLPPSAVTASTSARLASIALALFEQEGKVVHCNARWALLAPPGLSVRLSSMVRGLRRDGASIQQFRTPGRGGAKLIVRLEALDGMTVAIIGEESVTWPGDNDRARTRLWQNERLRVL